MFDILPNWHPVFVHFTVALLNVALVVFVLGLVVKSETIKKQAMIVARWNFWIAVVVTFATVIAGWLAYNSVAHDTQSHAAMTEHRNWALITTATLLTIAAGTWWLKSSLKFFGTGLLVVVILLNITAWHGGELVYRYGLGVMSMPIMEGEGHGEHSHGISNSQPIYEGMQKPQQETPVVKPHVDDPNKPHSH